jgi:hypothetical protein
MKRNLWEIKDTNGNPRGTEWLDEGRAPDLEQYRASEDDTAELTATIVDSQRDETPLERLARLWEAQQALIWEADGLLEIVRKLNIGSLTSLTPAQRVLRDETLAADKAGQAWFEKAVAALEADKPVPQPAPNWYSEE